MGITEQYYHEWKVSFETNKIYRCLKKLSMYIRRVYRRSYEIFDFNIVHYLFFIDSKKYDVCFPPIGFYFIPIRIRILYFRSLPTQ